MYVHSFKLVLFDRCEEEDAQDLTGGKGRTNYGKNNTSLNRGNESGLTMFLPPSLSKSLLDRRCVHDGPPLTVWIPTRCSYCSSTAVLKEVTY